MTKHQSNMAKQWYSVDAGKVLRAIKWLIQNNSEWKQYEGLYNKVASLVKHPILLNRSHIVLGDCSNNNLVLACLLQFRYGRGGLVEQRFKNNTTRSTQVVDIVAYTKYLAMQSLPQFHHELFTL
jgi:hypothetical protein